MLKDKERPLALKLVLSEFSALVFHQHNPVPHAVPISEKRKRKPPNSRGTRSLMSECHCLLSPGKKPESGTAVQTRILSSDKHCSVCFLIHEEDELISRDLSLCTSPDGQTEVHLMFSNKRNRDAEKCRRSEK